MAPAVPLPMVRQELRMATHDAHVRLNRHPILRSITRPSLDIQRYTLILQAYWCFYQAAETVIRQSLSRNPELFDYTKRYKTEWLEQDLQFFGIVPGMAGSGPHRLALEMPDGTSGLVGLMYPLEGSTLGGQVISGHLLRNLGLTATGGARFFNGYGRDTDRLWQEFNNFAEYSLKSSDERLETCRFARYIFEQFEACLDVHVS